MYALWRASREESRLILKVYTDTCVCRHTPPEQKGMQFNNLAWTKEKTESDCTGRGVCEPWELLTSGFVLGEVMLASHIKVTRWGQVTSGSLFQPRRFCDHISTGMNSPQENVHHCKQGEERWDHGFEARIRLLPFPATDSTGNTALPLPKITAWRRR